MNGVQMKLGMIGTRGMVGQVLMERMLAENDFKEFSEVIFFSTSQKGEANPYSSEIKNADPILYDAYDLEKLKQLDVILTCQGGDYTEKIHSQLRSLGFKGFWVDAASTLRMKDDATIILDPVNLDVIKDAIKNGKKDFVGGNCTVSLMMLALGGLFRANEIEWITSMTYQAASGAGARHMNELLTQNKFITDKTIINGETNLSHKILQVEKNVKALLQDKEFPTDNFGYPLAFNILPFIDSELENGQSREEWKGSVETNKILQSQKFIPVDGTCVRVGAMRCHSQGLTVKLNRDIPMSEIEGMIREHNPWVKVIANNKPDTLKYLTPAFASGTLSIPIGRLRKMNLGNQYLNAFTVGDQLLWGAAEPLRRMLRIILS
jgi:aspartate-semialdehyde dehydrogenase